MYGWPLYMSRMKYTLVLKCGYYLSIKLDN